VKNSELLFIQDGYHGLGPPRNLGPPGTWAPQELFDSLFQLTIQEPGEL